MFYCTFQLNAAFVTSHAPALYTYIISFRKFLIGTVGITEKYTGAYGDKVLTGNFSIKEKPAGIVIN